MLTCEGGQYRLYAIFVSTFEPCFGGKGEKSNVSQSIFFKEEVLDDDFIQQPEVNHVTGAFFSHAYDTMQLHKVRRYECLLRDSPNQIDPHGKYLAGEYLPTGTEGTSV